MLTLSAERGAGASLEPHPLYIPRHVAVTVTSFFSNSSSYSMVDSSFCELSAASSTSLHGHRAHHAHGLHGLPRTAGALRVNRGMSLHQHMLPHTPLLCTAPFAPSILGVISTPDR